MKQFFLVRFIHISQGEEGFSRPFSCLVPKLP